MSPRVLNWKQVRLALALLDRHLIDAGLQLEATHATDISNKIDQHKQTLDSRLYDERTFYRSFTKDITHAKQSIIIESPFLTERRVVQYCRQFKKLQNKGVKVRVNTRLPYHHDTILLQFQGWRAAKLLKANGVKVCFYKDMRHRKLAVIDDCILWEGSLNILSQSYSKEMMRRTVSKSLSRQMLCFTGADRWHW